MLSGSFVGYNFSFCSFKSLMRIKDDHFSYGPNREPVFGLECGV